MNLSEESTNLDVFRKRTSMEKEHLDYIGEIAGANIYVYRENGHFVSIDQKKTIYSRVIEGVRENDLEPGLLLTCIAKRGTGVYFEDRSAVVDSFGAIIRLKGDKPIYIAYLFDPRVVSRDPDFAKTIRDLANAFSDNSDKGMDGELRTKINVVFRSALDSIKDILPPFIPRPNAPSPDTVQ